MEERTKTLEIIANSGSEHSVQPVCRLCGDRLEQPFLDLGTQPLCESYLDRNHVNGMEPFYPLTVYVCQNCLLVQLEAFVSPEHIFTEYAYFSSYSDTWLKHARTYVQTVVDRFNLNADSFVVELASNDGYLLQYFAEHHVPVMGIEPAANVAEVGI